MPYVTRALDAQSVNVCRKVVNCTLICEHVCKPRYGPRLLILDLTTCTVEANSLRHPQGDAAIATVFGRKQTARRTVALCDLGFRADIQKINVAHLTDVCFQLNSSCLLKRNCLVTCCFICDVFIPKLAILD